MHLWLPAHWRSTLSLWRGPCCTRSRLWGVFAVWEIETEWNPSLLPWLFVVVSLPYPSFHKQMVASLTCQVYTDECVCMYVWVLDRTQNRTWQYHGRVLRNPRRMSGCLPLSSTRGCFHVYLPGDHVTGEESDESWLDVYEKACNTVMLLLAEWLGNWTAGKQIQWERVSRPHCMSVFPADVDFNRSLMPWFTHIKQHQAEKYFSLGMRAFSSFQTLPCLPVIIVEEINSDQRLQRQWRRQTATMRIQEPANC